LLNTYLTWADSATESQRLAFCNQINETTYLPGACDHVIERDEGIERRLTLGYPIYFRDGLLERQFIRLCRLFSRGVQRIQVEMDTDKLVA
jgi:hypothetical protein